MIATRGFDMSLLETLCRGFRSDSSCSHAHVMVIAISVGKGSPHYVDFRLGGADCYRMSTSALYGEAKDLGTSAKPWANLYTNDLHLKNDRGDWTVIEEEDYLSLRNNKTGKMFKIVMEEIEQ